MVRYGWGTPSILDDPLDLDWTYLATATATSGDVSIPRGRLVGGSGSINGQIFLRALPEDIERWCEHRRAGGRLADDGRCLPRARDGRPVPRSGAGPPADWVATQAAFVETCVAAGYGAVGDHNAPDAMGAGALPFNQDDRVRWSPALAYLTPVVRARPNLEIRPFTSVRRIEVDGGRVTGLTVTGRTVRAGSPAGEVIVAAGAIGTPHLLLLSGIGPADELAALGITPVADRRGVGRNLRDHPKAWVDWDLRDDVSIADVVPGLQTSARYTATGSPHRGDMMLYPNSVVTATVSEQHCDQAPRSGQSSRAAFGSRSSTTSSSRPGPSGFDRATPRSHPSSTSASSPTRPTATALPTGSVARSPSAR